MDTVQFGDSKSEAAHGLGGDRTESIASAGLGQPARRILPLEPATFEGGRLTFTMAVDPERDNCFTIKLWGSDDNPDRLTLFVDGKQVGYHHLGDVDQLDFGDEGGPAFAGRFFYKTSPLPTASTHGKRQVHCEIRCIGPIWGYGTSFAQYQKNMVVSSRGIYAVYMHTDGCFVPPVAERQGAAPLDPPVRSSPGIEVLDKVRARIDKEVASELKSAKPLNEMQCQFIARAYGIDWTSAHNNPAVVAKVAAGIDAVYAAWMADPKLAEADPATYNPGWFPFGPAGQAVTLLSRPLAPMLDQPITPGGPTRRVAWSQLLQAGRDFHVRHRRLYTNQSMITDLNICWSDRGVAGLEPDHVLPNDQAKHYLYQSMGLEPWLGSETDHGPERLMGDHYFELTTKGLTRELGYVGYYGEVLDWATKLYDATRPTPDAPGDPRLRDQLVKLAKARCVFRYPEVDPDGNRAMRIEPATNKTNEPQMHTDAHRSDRSHLIGALRTEPRMYIRGFLPCTAKRTA